jgi:hypothetical protein
LDVPWPGRGLTRVPPRREVSPAKAGLDIVRRRGLPVGHDASPEPIQTTTNGQANQVLAEHGRSVSAPNTCQQRQVGADPGPSSWLPAADGSLRAGDGLKAIKAVPPHADGADPVPDGPCRHLVRAAVCELASIHQGQRPEAESLALVLLYQCPYGLCRRSCS